MTGDEDHWRRLSISQFPLELKSVDVRKFQIENKARRRIGFFGFEELRSGSKCSHPESHGFNETGQRFLHAMVVVNHKDNRIVRFHNRWTSFNSSLCRGSVKDMVVPNVSFGVAHSLPLCPSTIDRQIARPIPIPLSFVVKKGSKIFSQSFRPTPLSSISTRAVVGPSCCERITILLGRSVTESIASSAFINKFRMSC